ncbi:unnamed protein product [Closterium sp. NIES-64]|nr:unnamed protein product [Closterium sp. NIES-64]
MAVNRGSRHDILALVAALACFCCLPCTSLAQPIAESQVCAQPNLLCCFPPSFSLLEGPTTARALTKLLTQSYATSFPSPPTTAQQQQPKNGGGDGGGGEKWKGRKDGQSKGGKGGFKGKCYVCGQTGHVAKYCQQRADKEADTGEEGSGGSSNKGGDGSKGSGQSSWGIVVPPSIVITDGQRFETEQLQDESSMDGVRQSGGTETGEQQIGEQQIGEEQIGDQQMVDPQSGEQQTGEPQTGEQEMWGIRDGGRVVASGTISAPLRRSTRITRGIPPLKGVLEGPTTARALTKLLTQSYAVGDY